MSSCFRCGKDLPEGQTECEYGCQAAPIDDREIREALRRIQQRENALVAIDWDKVKTLEDLLLVMGLLFDGVKIFRDSPKAEVLKRFLKEDK